MSSFRTGPPSGGRAEVLARLRDPLARPRIREDLLRVAPDDYWETVRIGSTHHPDNARFKGMPLADVAAALELDPVDAVLYLTDSDELMTVGFLLRHERGQHVADPVAALRHVRQRRSLRAPHGPLSHDHPHPRAYGSLTRFIRASLDGQPCPSRSSCASRRRCRRNSSGWRIGAAANGAGSPMSSVLDPADQTRSDYGNPHRLSTGIEHVFVNGIHTMKDGKLTGRRAGRLLA